MTDLARAAGVQLTFLRTVGPNLYAFSLTDAHADADCATALERLRSGPRVRSVAVDERRRVLG